MSIDREILCTVVERKNSEASMMPLKIVSCSTHKCLNDSLEYIVRSSLDYFVELSSDPVCVKAWTRDWLVTEAHGAFRQSLWTV